MHLKACLIFIGFASLAHLLFRFFLYILSCLAVSVPLPLPAVKSALLSLRALTSGALAWVLFSFAPSALLAAPVTMVLALGSELDEHLGRRTTAAFSTSDSQSQRLFNVFVFSTVCAVIAAYPVHLFFPMPREASARILSLISRHSFLQAVCIAGILVFAYRLRLLSEHARTLAYLAGSYAAALRRGKLKRFW